MMASACPFATAARCGGNDKANRIEQTSETAPIAPTPARQPARSAIPATDSRPPMPPSVLPAI